MHAIVNATECNDEITVPASRYLTKDKEKNVRDEINVHKKVQEIASKLQEMKKHRRKLNSSIEKLESDMGKLFDDMGVDCLEIDMGLLVRKHNEHKTEWFVEL